MLELYGIHPSWYLFPVFCRYWIYITSVFVKFYNILLLFLLSFDVQSINQIFQYISNKKSERDDEQINIDVFWRFKLHKFSDEPEGFDTIPKKWNMNMHSSEAIVIPSCLHDCSTSEDREIMLDYNPTSILYEAFQ